MPGSCFTDQSLSDVARTYRLSTGVHFRGTHGMFQRNGGVQISVRCLAARVWPHASHTNTRSDNVKRSFFHPQTGLAAGKETPCLDDGDPCILGHLGENAPKLSKRRVAERTR